MAVTEAHTSVHVDDPAAVMVRTFPAGSVGAFVEVQVGRVVSLLVHDLAVLDALTVQVAAARAALADVQGAAAGVSE